MSFRRQHIRNVRATIEAGTPLDGEYVFDQTLGTIRAGDGATLGGLPLKRWSRAYTVSPAQITANQNNYSPADMAIAEALFLDLDADRTITGFATGSTNRDITVYNTSAFRLTLANESASSTAGNRFHINSDITLRPYQGARLIYSATLSRWITIGRSDLGITDLPENVTLSGDISPTQIAANTNDYSPTGLSAASRLRLSTDASRNLTGIAGGADGRVLILINVGTNALVLKDADAGSTAANRFDFGADTTLGAKAVAVIQYDATDSRWKMLANTAGAAVANGAVTAVKLATSAIGVGAIVNGYLDWSVSGNALTVALKTLAGTDPTASDPVVVQTRSATVTDGKPAFLTVTAALSVVLSSGSSAGAVNATAFGLWALFFNDGGTARLGLVNTVSGVNIMALSAWGIASSTAEGGAGAADSAQTIYTGTAVTAKAYALFGRATWETGLATAGTWAAGPTRATAFGPGVPTPGQRVQVTRLDTGAVATGTTTIPFDDSIPQSSEGTQFMSQAHTPSSAANILAVSSKVAITNSAGPLVMLAALFQDSAADALKTVWQEAVGATYPVAMEMSYRLLAAGTAATTFKVRAGGHGAGTTSFNGQSGGREFGGTLNSYLEIEEIAA